MVLNLEPTGTAFMVEDDVTDRKSCGKRCWEEGDCAAFTFDDVNKCQLYNEDGVSSTSEVTGKMVFKRMCRPGEFTK